MSTGKLAIGVMIPCLLLSGCVVSEVPLSSPQAAQPDQSLVGTWIQQNDEEQRIVVIGRFPYTPDNQLNDDAVPRGIMSCQVASLGKDGELPEPTSMPLFFASKIGKDTYLNAFERKAVRFDQKWEIAPETRFMIMKYRVQKNTLEIWHLDTDKVKAAIAKDLIKGRVEANGLIRPAVVESAMSLAGYLASEGSTSLFADMPAATFVRAKFAAEK